MTTEGMTVQEIKSAYGAEQTQIVHQFGDRADEIASRDSSSVPNRQYLDYSQVEQILVDKKRAEIEAEATEARKRLEDLFERYEQNLKKRAEAVKASLFSGIEDSGALARAALASREELEELMNLGAFTGNRELSRIAFVAAERKGHGDLVNKYLNEVDGSSATRDLYEEWRAIPPKEQLSRQRENLDRLISVPDRDRLVPRSQVSLYG